MENASNPLFDRAIELQMEIDDAVKSLASIKDPQEQVALESTIRLLMEERERMFAIIGELSILTFMGTRR